MLKTAMDAISTLSLIYRRQILTTKVDPRAVRVKCFSDRKHILTDYSYFDLFYLAV